MRLDGFGLLVEDMGKMIRFYRDVLGFEIKEEENASNVYLVKDGTLFLLYGRKDFEKMTNRRYEYIKGLNGHFEMALYVDTFEEVDEAYRKAVEKGAISVLEPELEPWGQRTCYIVRRHIVGGENRTLISVKTPLRLCRTGTCRKLSAERPQIVVALFERQLVLLLK